MQITEKALVITVGRFREADAWVRYLCPAQGVRTGFAFGGLKSRKRFLGCLDTLNLVLFTAKQARGADGPVLHLQEGSLIHGFQDLKKDSSRIGAAANCLKFAEAVQIDSDGARLAWDTLVETLYCLESGRLDAETAPLIFRAKLTFAHGYAPDLTKCHQCKTPLEAAGRVHLMVDKGRIICQTCRGKANFVQDNGPGGQTLPISPGALKTLEWIKESPPRDWPKLSMSPMVRRECFEAVDRFVAWHLDLAWDKGRFRKSS